MSGEMQVTSGIQAVELLKKTAADSLPGLWSFGMRLLVAALLLGIGFRLVKFLRRLMMRSLERAEVEPTLRGFLDALIQAVLTGILVFMAAEELGMDSASVIALMGSAGLALGLALQGSLANFAGGVLILLMKPFKAGDYIIAPDGEGTVSSIGLVYTTLLTVDNRRIVIPNGTLSNSALTNVTAMAKRRLDLSVGIGYEDDLLKAKRVLQAVFEQCPEIIKEEGITVFVDCLGESRVMLGIRGWVAAEDYWTARWELTEEIKLAFDREGITIPYDLLQVYVQEPDGGRQKKDG